MKRWNWREEHGFPFLVCILTKVLCIVYVKPLRSLCCLLAYTTHCIHAVNFPLYTIKTSVLFRVPSLGHPEPTCGTPRGPSGLLHSGHYPNLEMGSCATSRFSRYTCHPKF